MNEDEPKNVIEQLICVLNSPRAKREGCTFTAEESKIWTIELQAYLHKANNPVNTF